MSRMFRSVWWTVELPDGWSGQPDIECTTFHANPSLGALQISSARKDTAPVTGEDLKGFSKERLASGVEIEGVNYRSFSGFSAQHFDGGKFWREWWLMADHLMVYATYNVVQGAEDLERDKIESILASMAPV